MSANTDRYENAVARYFEAWNAREPEARAQAAVTPTLSPTRSATTGSPR